MISKFGTPDFLVYINGIFRNLPFVIRNRTSKDHQKYDYVFDAVGKSTFGKCKPLLKDKGIYTSSEGFQNLLLAFITPLFLGKRVVFLPPTDINAGLSSIKELIEKGKFKPVIDKKYAIDRIAEA